VLDIGGVDRALDHMDSSCERRPDIAAGHIAADQHVAGTFGVDVVGPRRPVNLIERVIDVPDLEVDLNTLDWRRYGGH